MKKRKFTKHLTLLAAAAAGVATLSAGAYASFHAVPPSNDQMETQLGNVQVSLIEKIVDRGDHGAFTTSNGEKVKENVKEFWGLARGTKETIIRAKIVCSAEYYTKDNRYVPITELNDAVAKYQKNQDNGNPVYDAPFTYRVKSSKNWIYNPEDEYWYYNRVLNKGGLYEKITEADGTGENYPAGQESTTDPIVLENILIGRHNQMDHPDDNCNENWARWIRQDTRINVHVEMEAVQATNGAYLLQWGNVDPDIIDQIENGEVAADRDTAIAQELDLDNPADRVLTPIFKR